MATALRRHVFAVDPASWPLEETALRGSRMLTLLRDVSMALGPLGRCDEDGGSCRLRLYR